MLNITTLLGIILGVLIGTLFPICFRLSSIKYELKEIRKRLDNDDDYYPIRDINGKVIGIQTKYEINEEKGN